MSHITILPIDIWSLICEKSSIDTKCNLRLVSNEFSRIINFMEIKISRFNDEFTYLNNRISEIDMQRMCKTKRDWDIYFSAIEYCANHDCNNKYSFWQYYTQVVQYGDYFFDKGERFYHRKTPALGLTWFWYKQSLYKQRSIKIKRHIPYCIECMKLYCNLDNACILDRIFPQ